MTQESDMVDPTLADLARWNELLASSSFNMLKSDPHAEGKISFEAFIADMHAEDVAQISAPNRVLLMDVYADEFRRWQLSKMLGVPVGKDESGQGIYVPAFDMPKQSSFVLEG